METLKKYIDYYIHSYMEINYEYKRNLDLLNEYAYDFDTFISYDFSTYLKIFYVGYSKNGFDKYKSLIEKNKEYFNSIDETDYIGLKELLQKIEEISEKDNLDEYIIKEKSYSAKIEKFKTLDYSLTARTFLLLTFSDDSEKMNFEAYNEFLEYFLNGHGKSIFYALVEIYNLKNYVRELKKIDARKKDKQKVLESYTKKYDRIIDIIKSFKHKFELEYKELEKEKKKNISILKELERDLDSGQPINLAKYKKILNHDKIITEIILYNSKFKNNEYQNTIRDKEAVETNELSLIESELIKYNIKLDIRKINVEKDEAINKIKLLSVTKEIIKFNNVLLYFINNVSIKDINIIINMIIEKEITEEFVLENIYDLDKENINDFISNIKLLKGNKINIMNIIKYNKDILFFENEKLKTLINIYLSYGIIIDSECYKFEWLEKDLSHIIDKYIEINKYELIKNNLSLLNSSSNMIIKRCLLYMYLNNSVVNEQNKLRGSLRKEENFIMTDEELNETIITNYDNYIPKDIIEVLKEKDIFIKEVYNINNDLLNEYLINPYTYKFNNILISKNKIIRTLNILLNKELDKTYTSKDLLFYSIIYNYPKLLLSNDIEVIKNIINKKVKKLIK